MKAKPDKFQKKIQEKIIMTTGNKGFLSNMKK